MYYRVIVLSFMVVCASVAHADNLNFQTFFTDVCARTGGTLIALCVGGGDLSGDSESSLNPSQGLSINGGALSASASKAKESRERNYSADEPGETARISMDFGPYAFLLHGRIGSESLDRIQDVNAERGYEADYKTLEVGMDRRFTDALVIGALIAYESFELEFDRENAGGNFTPLENAGETESDGYAVTAYGAINFGESGYVDVSVGYIDTDYDIRRNSVFQEPTRNEPQTNIRTEGSTDGSQLWGAINTGAALNRSNWTHGANIGLTYADSTIDGYTETDVTGNDMNMIVGETRRSSFVGHIGVSTQVAISTEIGVLLPQLRVEYSKEFLDSPDALQLSFVADPDPNSTPLTLGGDTLDDDYFDVSLGVVASLPNGWMPFLDYENRFGQDDFDRYRVTLGLRKNFQ